LERLDSSFRENDEVGKPAPMTWPAPFVFLALSAPALGAQPPAPAACGAINEGLEANLAPWRSPVPAPAVVVPGEAVRVRPAQGAVTLGIAEAGTYGIALDIPAWIDVSRDGRALASVRHGHGPACSTICKIVDFELSPGRYTVTLSRTEAPNARILVVRR
jgi:hypothetical protein